MKPGPITLAQYLDRRQARLVTDRRPTCSLCRKATTTCYCHLLKPFAAPIEIVILQNRSESRNAIATARIAHLSMTNSRLIIGNSFEEDERVEALLNAPGKRNLMLYPRPDAEPLDDVLRASVRPDADPLVLWVLDAKWAEVPKMLRLSPRVKRLPATAFVPDAPSRFCVRTQPKPTCVSTVEAIHAVIARHAKITGALGTGHDDMLDVFRYLVRQQLGFCDWQSESRHEVAKRIRRERRAAREASGVPGG